METNIIFAIATVVVVLAAVILTYRFAPRREEFIVELLRTVGEPVPLKKLEPIASPRRKREFDFGKNRGGRKTSWRVALGCS